MSSRGRAVLASLAIAVLFALPLLPEILGARRLVFRDAHITHWPWRRVAMQSLAAGRAPFVNEAASGGQPLLANPNAVLLYPTVLLEKIVRPAAAFNLHYLLHVLWAYLGARLLARRLGQSEGAAFLSGIAFAFSGAMLSYTSAFANSGPAASWLPWCGAAALAVAGAGSRRDLVRGAAALALALGLQLLAGEPAISFLTLLFCLAAGLAAAFRARGAVPLPARLLAAAAAGAGAAALAAPLLLPLAQVLPLTYRGQHLYSERAFGASPFAAWRFLEWFFPRFSGDPGALGAGAHWQFALHRGDLVYLWCVTFGVIPLALVLMAGSERDFWRAPTIALATGGAAALLLSFGPALPFWRALAGLDVARRLRYPIKFYLLTTLALALLAGFAVDRLSGRRPRRREALVLGFVVLVFVAGLAVSGEGGLLERRVRPLLDGLALPPTVLLPAIRRTFAVDALLGLAAAGVLAAVLFWKRRATASGYVLGFAALLFALPGGLPLFVSAAERDLERPPAIAGHLSGPGRLFVSSRLPEFNVLATGSMHPDLVPRVSRLARVQIEELIPGTGEPFGVRYVFDADPDGSYGWFNRLASEAVSASTPEERTRLLRAFSARWVLAEEGEPYPGARFATGLTVAGRRLVLSEIERPVAELRWAGRELRRRALSGVLDRLRREGFDPETEVILPGPVDREGTGDARARLADPRVEADRASVRIEADAPGHVVFSRTWFPAWKARLDGREVPVLVANARDLAVAVPGGSHRLEIHWDDAPFRRGVILQAAVLLFLLVIGVLAARGRGDAERRA